MINKKEALALQNLSPKLRRGIENMIVVARDRLQLTSAEGINQGILSHKKHEGVEYATITIKQGDNTKIELDVDHYFQTGSVNATVGITAEYGQSGPAQTEVIFGFDWKDFKEADLSHCGCHLLMTAPDRTRITLSAGGNWGDFQTDSCIFSGRNVAFDEVYIGRKWNRALKSQLEYQTDLDLTRLSTMNHKDLLRIAKRILSEDLPRGSQNQYWSAVKQLIAT